MTLEEKVASCFSVTLCLWLGEAKMREVVHRNRARTDRSFMICHSHDFCDANTAMEEAMSSVLKAPVDTQNEENRLLWNAAWRLAFDNDFFTPGAPR